MLRARFEPTEHAIREAWALSDVSPDRCDYVELHGTAFQKGDPIEVRAIASALGTAERADGRSVSVGAVKSNIGNLESAAAVASVIKVALSLHHQQLRRSHGGCGQR